MRKIVAIIAAFLMTTSFANAEVAVLVDHVEKGTAYVRTYSTVPLGETTGYDLYTIVKVNGKWEKEMYIRSVELPPTFKERKGKYKYFSKKYSVERLARGHVYALIPQDKGNHCSKPFWKKPSRRIEYD